MLFFVVTRIISGECDEKLGNVGVKSFLIIMMILKVTTVLNRVMVFKAMMKIVM